MGVAASSGSWFVIPRNLGEVELPMLLSLEVQEIVSNKSTMSALIETSLVIFLMA
jgi:hypothetical protein